MRAAPAPMLCLVTDRRRLCQAADLRGAIPSLVAQARFAAEAGVHVIQVRERDLEAMALADVTGAILDAVRGSSTRVVVNDRVDVAIATGSDGVHLRSDSIACDRVRASAPTPFLVGRSVHGVHEARAISGAADYLIAGTVFLTPSKPGLQELLGCEGLHRVARAVREPVLAIGGITIERVGEVARTGASGLAAIGLFIGPDGPMPLTGIVADVRRRFEQVASLGER